jgi:hypothetical protein
VSVVVVLGFEIMERRRQTRRWNRTEEKRREATNTQRWDKKMFLLE